MFWEKDALHLRIIIAGEVEIHNSVKTAFVKNPDKNVDFWV